MDPEQIHSDCLQVGVELYLGSQGLVVLAKQAVAPAILEKIVASKTVLLPFLESRGLVSERIPLSDQQQRIYIEQQRSPRSCSYNIPYAVRLRGPLDVERLHAALEAIVAKHTSLRNHVDEEHLDLKVAAVPKVDLPRHRLTDERALEEKLGEFLLAPFDLTKAPLFRFNLLMLGEQDHVLSLVFHHFIVDGISLLHILDDLASIYERGAAGVDGRDMLSCRDVALEQHSPDWLLQEAAQRSYWSEVFADFESDFSWPRYGSAQGEAREETRTLRAEIDVSRTAIIGAARDMGVSAFCLYATGLAILAHLFTSAENLIIGFPTSNRRTRQQFSAVGLLANTLALRASIRGSDSISELARKFALQIEGLTSRATLKIEDLSETLIGRAQGGHDLIPIMLNYPRNAGPASETGTGLTFAPFFGTIRAAKFPLEVSIVESGARQRVEFEADPRSIPRAVAESLLRSYAQIVRQIVEGGVEITVRDIRLDGYADFGSASQRDVAAFEPVRDSLNASIRRFADRIAVQIDGKTLTYRALGAAADGIAATCAAAGVKRGQVIAIYCERSFELAAAYMAAIKLGAVFLPIELDTPARRIRYMIEDAKPRVVLSSTQGKRALEGLSIDSLEISLAGDSGCPEPCEALGPDDAAYILYTSGSTGTPKGVVNSQLGLANRLRWAAARYRLGPGDNVLHKTPISFDVSVWEILLPLLYGAKLVLARPDGHRDPEYLGELIVTDAITILHFVPSMLSVFLESGARTSLASPRLRYVICSGEALTAPLIQRFYRHAGRNTELHNLYGPTEAAIDVTQHVCPREGLDDVVPIGGAVPDTTIYVADTEGKPLALGALGEIVIAGDQVALGYLNLEELTRRKFGRSDAIGSARRIYRTGDIGAFRAQRELLYFGRMDDQVKIGGVRIEPAEVATAIGKVDGVTASCVLSHVSKGQTYLVGFVVLSDGRSEPGAQDILDEIASMLPAAMVPREIRFVASIPTKANGKADLAVLRSIMSEQAAPTDREREIVLPRNPVEETLIRIWRQVLAVDSPISTDDNFFSLGGNSIRAIQVVSRGRALGLSFRLRDLFEHRTIAALARVVSVQDASPPPVAGAKIGQSAEVRVPASSLLRGLIFESADNDDYRVFLTTIQLLVDYRGETMHDALQSVLRRHPFLNSYFSSDANDHITHIFAPPRNPAVDVHDWRDMPAEPMRERLRAWQDAERRKKFDWTRPPLFRISVHLMRKGEFYLTLTEPFLDGWSASTVLNDLTAGYVQRLWGQDGSGSGTPPAPLNIYHQFLQNEAAARKDDGARDHLMACVKSHEGVFISDFASGPVLAVPEYRRTSVAISADTQKALADLVAQEGLPVKSAFLAAYARVLAFLTGRNRVLAGVMTNARPEIDQGDAFVGLFLNTMPYCMELGGGTWRELCHEAFRREVEFLRYRDFPFAELLRRSLRRTLFDITLNYTDFFNYEATSTALKDRVIGEFMAYDQTYFALTVHCGRDPVTRRLRAELEYDASIVPPTDAERFSALLERALFMLSNEPDKPALSQALGERPAVLRGETVAAEPPFRLEACFEALADADPKRTAIVDGGHAYSFAMVEAAANRWANLIRKTGVAPRSVIGVAVPRSADFVAALLGVLKAGCIGLPLDAFQPAKRREDDLGIAGANVLLVSDSSAAEYMALEDFRLLTGDEARRQDGARLARDCEGDRETAFVMLTSGSAGRRKAVPLSHASLLNRLRWGWKNLSFRADDRAIQKTNVSFVDSLNEIFGPLLQGVPQYIAPDAIANDASALAEFIVVHGITRLVAVPSLLRELTEGSGMEALRALRVCISSGETLPPSLAGEILRAAPDLQLVNIYGTTEVTADATWHRVSPQDCASVSIPIGRPIANCEVRIADERGNDAALNATGEIWIGGAAVAQDYLGGGDRSGDQRFASRVRSDGGEERFFRTGDLGSVRSDGVLCYRGRKDRQIKLRGIRVSPEEIELAVARHPMVKAAAVLPIEEGGGSVSGLQLYVVPAPGAAIDEHSIRAHLMTELPLSHQPSGIGIVEDLPKTSSGKIAWRQLSMTPNRGAPNAEMDATERQLAGIWREILSVDHIGRDSSYFDAGGTSLQAQRILNRINKELGINLRIRSIFEYPVLSDFANCIKAAVAARRESMPS